MKRKLILHIPHSSTRIPFKDGYVLDDTSLKEEILILTDWYTDDLFFSEDDEMIIADFSRSFCDPERFSDDSQEVMAQYGMGVLYEKTDDGRLMRKVTRELRDRILKEYYWKHHYKLSESVNKQIEMFGEAVIVDCHSFPDTPLKRDLDRNLHRPDFNIGTDDYHTPKEFINYSIAFFKDKGYTLGIDWPYRGSIVPMEHYHKNKNVKTIMLEINRALHLQESTNKKSEKYLEIKETTGEFLEMIKTYCNQLLVQKRWE